MKVWVCEKKRSDRANWEPEKERGGGERWSKSQAVPFLAISISSSVQRDVSPASTVPVATHTPSVSMRKNSLHDTAHLRPSLLYRFTLGRCRDLHPPQDLPSLPQSLSLSVLNRFLSFTPFIAFPPWCLLDSTRQAHRSLSPASFSLGL